MNIARFSLSVLRSKQKILSLRHGNKTPGFYKVTILSLSSRSIIACFLGHPSRGKHILQAAP